MHSTQKQQGFLRVLWALLGMLHLMVWSQEMGMSCYQSGSTGEKKSWSVEFWQQGEAGWGRSTHTLLEWGMLTVDCIKEEHSCPQWAWESSAGHEEECSGRMTGQSAGWSAVWLLQCWDANKGLMELCSLSARLFLEVWVTLGTEGPSLQEGCSESLAVLQKRHFAMHQVVGTSTGWDQCNLEYQVASWSLVPAQARYHSRHIIHWWSC